MKVDPFWLKLAFFTLALVLDRLHLLTEPLAVMLYTAIGGTALVGAAAAFKTLPAPQLPLGWQSGLVKMLTRIEALEAAAAPTPPAQPSILDKAAEATAGGAKLLPLLFIPWAMLALFGVAGLAASTGCAGAEQRLVADLPAIESGTGITCTILEGTLQKSSVGALVDVLCTGAEGLEAVTGAILTAAAGSTASSQLGDAGASVAVTYHALPLPVAQAVVSRFAAGKDAGSGG